MGAYSIYIGSPAINYDKELLNPYSRPEGAYPEETCISASYSAEMNSAGSCSFRIPPSHPYYSEIRPLITEVIVVEIDNVVWFGRVLSMRREWNNVLDVTCEGGLGFLNDSVIAPRQYFNETPEQRFRSIIQAHNAQVPTRRQMSIATVSIDAEYADRQESGETGYQTGMSAINGLVSTYGGYLYCLMNATTGLPDIYWVTSRNFVSAETVEYAKNLLDFRYTEDRSGIFTVLLPLGANVDVERLSYEDDGTPIMEWDDTTMAYTEVQAKEKVEMPLRLDFTKRIGPADEDGIREVYYTAPSSITASAYLNGSYKNTYGAIVRTITFVDATTIESLRTKAKTWLNEHDLGGIKIEVDAQDLRFLDVSAGRFYLGMTVRLISEPHSVSGNDLVITKIDANVKTLAKKITLGELPGKTLSDLVGRTNIGFRVGKEPDTKYHKVKNKHEMKSNYADQGIWYIPK